VSTTVGSATYDESHNWSISKTGGFVSGYAGQVLSGGQWIVRVTESAEPANVLVTGRIDIVNPTDTDINVVVSAALNDGTVPKLNCGDEGAPTVKAGRAIECTFLATPATADATAITATVAVIGGPEITSTAAISFVKTVLGTTATLTDSYRGQQLLNEALVAGQGPWSFTVTDPVGWECSLVRSEYEELGTGYEFSRANENEALLAVADTSRPLFASAPLTYTCRAGFLDVFKTTDGHVDPTKAWELALFPGPDGWAHRENVMAAVIALDDADGVLPFRTALDPNRTYTVCEFGIPTGHTTYWSLNGNPVDAYNPDGVEDAGNRCVDFGAGTPIPANAGETLTFAVDIRGPSGEPRTPLYWKRWNRCDGRGDQAERADRLAMRAGYPAGEGWRVGLWLLEDVLNPSIGGSIIWDDILSDGLVVEIASCEQAVEILDHRVVTANGLVSDGDRILADAVRRLAAHLLATQLNLGAGACRTPEVLSAAAEAERFLDRFNFDGTKPSAYLTFRSVKDWAEALRLTDRLADYNRGKICGRHAP
jgi:hypothetical protein